MKKAVALKYPQGVEAPIIVAKGEGKIAEKILTEAEKNSILVKEDETLIQLLDDCDTGSMVPESAWKALSVIFSYIISGRE